MAKHSPGPWREGDEDCENVVDVDGRPVVTNEGAGGIVGRWDVVDGKIVDWGNAGANARLIAAAPELYEALSARLVECDCPKGDCHRCERDRALIKRIEGEP